MNNFPAYTTEPWEMVWEGKKKNRPFLKKTQQINIPSKYRNECRKLDGGANEILNRPAVCWNE